MKKKEEMKKPPVYASQEEAWQVYTTKQNMAKKEIHTTLTDKYKKFF